MGILRPHEYNENKKENIIYVPGFDERINKTYTWRFDHDFVVNSKSNREYSIVYHRGNFDKNNNENLIPVKNSREVELLLLSLREEASVIMDAEERKQCGLWDWLYGRTYANLFSNLKWSYQEEEEMVDIIEKIPLPTTFSDSLLKTDHHDLERIDQAYVHKSKQENVLISKPYHYGNMFYFTGFKKSSEFNIDHDSDHLEGIIIFEAARQAGIASVHLTGIPLSGAIVISKSKTRYTKFVECHEPYIIRTIPIIKQRGGYSSVIFNILQNGHSCATGYVVGMSYETKEAYNKFKNAHIITKLSNENAVGM